MITVNYAPCCGRPCSPINMARRDTLTITCPDHGEYSLTAGLFSPKVVLIRPRLLRLLSRKAYR